MALVADVGGTNTRLALTRDGMVQVDTIRRYANDDHPDFLSVVRAFLSESGVVAPDGAAVALAGPASASGGRLTNRDWSFDVPMMAEVTTGPVRYLNDLKAMAYAVPGLQARDVEALTPPATPPDRNGQSLVIGVGTGFNVSQIARAGGETQAMDAEYGHTALPAAIADALRARYGDFADAFPTVEECFSGRGLARLRTRAELAEMLPWYADLLGVLTRELVMAFMPMDGVYFAGGVARAILGSAAGRDAFAARVSQPFGLNSGLARVPAVLITDDYAPLRGCAQYLMRA